jgi:hypothetical protein
VSRADKLPHPEEPRARAASRRMTARDLWGVTHLDSHPRMSLRSSRATGQLLSLQLVAFQNLYGDIAQMKHSEFKIGMEFMTGAGRWRCTDVGTRTIVAIRLDLDHDTWWYSGPPYPVVEMVFDEDGMEDCDLAPRERTFDDSGKARLATIDVRLRRPEE